MCRKCRVFPHRRSESKIAREMLCFTIETAAGGCKGRRCEAAGVAMVAYGRLCSPILA